MFVTVTVLKYVFLFAGNCKATLNNISCRWQDNTSNMSLNTNVTPLFQWIRPQQFLLLHVKGTIHIPSWVEKRLFMKFLKQEISLRPKQIQRYTHCITKQKRHTQSCRRLKSLIWNARSQKKNKKKQQLLLWSGMLQTDTVVKGKDQSWTIDWKSWYCQRIPVYHSYISIDMLTEREKLQCI